MEAIKNKQGFICDMDNAVPDYVIVEKPRICKISKMKKVAL